MPFRWIKSTFAASLGDSLWLSLMMNGRAATFIMRRWLCVLMCYSFAPLALATLPNAWQVSDDSTALGGGLNYTNLLTSTQHVAATNGGFTYTVRARFVEDRGSATMAMAYGLGNRRFQIGFDLNAHGDLVATLLEDASYTVTRGGTGTNFYHTYSIQFNPTNDTATFRVDSVVMAKNWSARAIPMAAGQVYWGAGSSAGRGVMNFHQVTFEVNGLGVLASYDSGTVGNPDPAIQGWMRRPDLLLPGMSDSSVADLALLPIVPWWQTWWFGGVAFAAMIGLVGGGVRLITAHRYRKRLAELARKHELEQERSRIARDMHDVLGSDLVKISMLGESAEAECDSPDLLRPRLQKMIQTARTAVRSMDEIVWVVNPKNDTLEDLASYLCQFAREHFELTPTRLHLDVPVDVPHVPLRAELRHDLFLVVKEALNNALKHAHAADVWLRVSTTSKTLRITVEDNGCGVIAKSNGRPGHGMENMRNRITQHGGILEVETREGSGIRIVTTLTLD